MGAPGPAARLMEQTAGRQQLPGLAVLTQPVGLDEPVGGPHDDTAAHPPLAAPVHDPHDLHGVACRGYPLVWSTGLARAGVGCQGPCPIRSWPVDGLGAAGVWSTAGAGFGILADLARGVRGSGPSSTQPESPGSHHCSRASTPSTAARVRDADQGPNARQLGDGVGSVLRDKSAAE